MRDSGNLHTKKKIRFSNYSTIMEVIEKVGIPLLEGRSGTIEDPFLEIEDNMLMFNIRDHLNLIKKQGFVLRETEQYIEITRMTDITFEERVRVSTNEILNGKSTFIIRHRFRSKIIRSCTNENYLILDYDKDKTVERITIDEAIEAYKTKKYDIGDGTLNTIKKIIELRKQQ